MAADLEARALAETRENTVAWLKRQVAVRAAYRKLLLGEDGQLTPSARMVLADLAETAKLGKVMLAAEPHELLEREGRRALVLHIFARLDSRRLADLADSIREDRK